MKKKENQIENSESQFHILSPETDVVENVGQTHGRSRTNTAILIVLSVLLSFAIWTYAKSIDTTVFEEEIGGVTVQLENTEGLPFSVISGYNTTISVKVSGKRANLRSISAEDISAWADLGFITAAGEYTVPIHVSLPNGVTKTSLSADSVKVYLDNTITVAVPVEVEMTDWILDDTYELGDATTNPRLISVTGPETVLDTISSAKVSVALGRVTNTMTLSGRPVLLDGEGNRINNPYVKMATENIDVTVPVYLVREVPLSVNFKYGYLNEDTATYSVSPATVMVKGEASVVSAIESIPLAEIDETKITSGSVNRQILLPDQLVNVSGVTTAEVSIVHQGTTQRTFAVSNIRVENEGAHVYTVSDRAVNVTVRMSNAIMPYVTADNIVLTVDMGTIAADASGNLQLPATVSFENIHSYLLYAIGDYQVSVQVS